jgi:hypothetical protein
MGSTTTTAYQLEGSLLEACSCEVLCPCWIGEDPDRGTCESFNAYYSTAARSAAWMCRGSRS